MWGGCGPGYRRVCPERVTSSWNFRRGTPQFLLCLGARCSAVVRFRAGPRREGQKGAVRKGEKTAQVPLHDMLHQFHSSYHLTLISALEKVSLNKARTSQ
jgi:hypothetical protein